MTTTTLALVARELAELQERVGQLSGAQDSIASNAFTLNAEGKVEEILTGTLEAEGIIFQEGPIENSNTASILWELADTIREKIIGFGETLRSTLQLEARSPNQADGAQIFLEAQNSRQSVSAAAGPLADLLDRLLINSKNESSFIQTATADEAEPGRVVLHAGEGIITWPGGSLRSNETDFALAAGASPIVLVTPVAKGGLVGAWTPYITNVNGAGFSLFGYAAEGGAPGAGSANFFYLVIGDQ
jgi:hypothetical protein